MVKTLQRLISRVRYFHLLILGVLLLIGAVSCQAANRQTDTQPEVEATVTQIAATASPQPTAVSELAAQDSDTEQSNQCLACHEDQQALMDTADKVEVVESENSGEG